MGALKVRDSRTLRDTFARAMEHPLSRILADVERHRAERPVVIFDLDGTLYDNRPRTIRILHAFAAALEHEHARDAAVIRALGPDDLSYLLDDTLLPRGVDKAVVERAKRVWFSRFFTDAACADDVPVRGAVPFARACYDRGATVVYLTGRDIPGMLVGTVRTLRDDGFPIGVPRTELVFKPTFENEPGNCNMFRARWPDSHAVLVTTQHAPGAPALHDACVRVPNFDHP